VNKTRYPGCRTFFKFPEECRMKKCVGCGYCCKKALCALAVYVLPASDDREEGDCPFLYFEEGRHWCALALYEAWAEELYIGEGCTSSLNTERRKYAE